jgi:hypothetical protein
MAQHPPGGQGLLGDEASPSHSDTPHSVGLLWRNDRLVAETSTWQYTILTKMSVPPEGFEPTIAAGDGPHTHILDRAATGIGVVCFTCLNKHSRSAYKGQSSRLGTGRGANNSSPQKLALLRNGYKCLGPRLIFCYDISNGKGPWVLTHLQKVVWGRVEWFDLAQDRDRWRALVLRVR